MFPDAFRLAFTPNLGRHVGGPCDPQLRRVERTATRMTRADEDRQQQVDDQPLPLWIMKITQPACRQMLDYLVSRPPEAAGLLLGPADDDLLVTHFLPDTTGHGTPASFELGTDDLNQVLKRMKEAGINCKGIGHSHPGGIIAPSQGDVNYLRRVFGLPGNSDATQFFMPIVCDGRVFPYVYVSGRVCRAEIVLV